MEQATFAHATSNRSKAPTVVGCRPVAGQTPKTEIDLFVGFRSVRSGVSLLFLPFFRSAARKSAAARAFRPKFPLPIERGVTDRNNRTEIKSRPPLLFTPP